MSNKRMNSKVTRAVKCHLFWATADTRGPVLGFVTDMAISEHRWGQSRAHSPACPGRAQLFPIHPFPAGKPRNQSPGVHWLWAPLEAGAQPGLVWPSTCQQRPLHFAVKPTEKHSELTHLGCCKLLGLCPVDSNWNVSCRGTKLLIQSGICPNPQILFCDLHLNR